jgi:hypothetical protein
MTNGSIKTDQFLVAPRNASAAGELAAFEEALRAYPDAAILSRGGRPDQPRVVVTLGPQTLQELKSRFGAVLIIERNAPLFLP